MKIESTKPDLKVIAKECAVPLTTVDGMGLSITDLINALPFYVMILDANHNIMETNEAVFSQLGIKREDILGKFCPTVIHGIDHPFKGCPLEQAVETNQAVERELQDEKSKRWVRSIVYPIKRPAADGKKLFLHIVLDVTARKQAEEQLQVSHEQLRSLSAHLESVREEEKKKIARDLHDEASQLLASLNVHLEAAIETLPEGSAKTKKLLEYSQTIALRILDELHKLIYDLRPALLDELGLVPAINSLADSHLTVSGVKVKLSTTGKVRRLKPALETTLFRVIQETFNNIVKHAHAKHVQVDMAFKNDRVNINIQDDGTGFDIKQANNNINNLKGLGLLGIKERITLIGGSMIVNSSPGSGTEIKLEVPLISEENNG